MVGGGGACSLSVAGREGMVQSWPGGSTAEVRGGRCGAAGEAVTGSPGSVVSVCLWLQVLAALQRDSREMEKGSPSLRH